MNAGEEVPPQAGGLVSIQITDILGLAKASKNLSPVAEKAVSSIISGLSRVYGTTLEPALLGYWKRKDVTNDSQILAEIDQRFGNNPPILNALRARVLGTAVFQEDNIHAAAKRALQIASDINTTKEIRPLKPDFVVDWIEHVKHISDPIVQEMWASLLAQATTAWDGRAPKPVIDLLAQFDIRVALDFEFMAGYLAATDAVPKGFPLFDEPINYNPAMLEDLGVIVDSKKDMLRVEGSGFYFTRSKATRLAKVYLPAWELGARAKELAKWVFSGRKPEFDCVQHIFDNPPELARALAVFVDGKYRLAFCSSVTLPGKTSHHSFEIRADNPDDFGNSTAGRRHSYDVRSGKDATDAFAQFFVDRGLVFPVGGLGEDIDL